MRLLLILVLLGGCVHKQVDVNTVIMNKSCNGLELGEGEQDMSGKELIEFFEKLLSPTLSDE